MNLVPAILLITALTMPTQFLVLRSGDRINVDGSVTIERGIVTFRSFGRLYSIPETEVDFDATRALTMPTTVVRPEAATKLKVTPEERDRLLHDLEQNHAGTAPGELQPVTLATPAQRERATQNDEWNWKSQAQAYEESIRRAREEIDMLRSRAEQLQNEIRFLLARGYQPSQFTYDSTQLQLTRDSIPRAELELQRAEREYAQFQDNARRQGIPPGWLR